MNDEALILAVLDEIERREARSLTWGLVDGFLTRDELVDIVEDLLNNERFTAAGLSFTYADDVIDALTERALIFVVGEEDGRHFRSRMAETVRLLFRLRQLFPKHGGPNGWQNAPPLVADFRFIRKQRKYPDRTLKRPAVLSSFNETIADAYARQAISAFLDEQGEDYALADFQVSATARILRSFASSRSTATLISAGTGSGKTLAFYLPAIARISSHIRRDPTAKRWVKVLAIYPRNELLKDQFSEVYAQARKLDRHLASQGRRKILIGTFFGLTPYQASGTDLSKGWRSHPAGAICEYLRCPNETCGADMVWRDTDRRSGVERLHCLECESKIESDEIVLTRSRLERESPDVLFTTTEMLNQRMGDSRFNHLFGLGDRCERPVEMVLLDEVHTYSGTSGAQVAFLLRRWRHALRRAVSFVGLSATLPDGARFFARLTGVGEGASTEISPRASDMKAEGAEYMIALRGDPVSRTALLSTTIQTAMLLSRMLDPPDAPRSDGIFGEKLFLFADNIDVINRLYFSLLDAEGRRSNGTIDAGRTDGGLAALRRPMGSRLRQLHGQDWRVPVDIGHTLQPPDRKSVGRVMSMDPGVGRDLDIIVATAALEVGFNDPDVGGVVQHKAPVDSAQFLQRKGRAGRLRRMRPWTAVVLSDYGRDRIAYQGYDLLFDPSLQVRTLPIANRYVERIQGVYATLDYLSQAMAGWDRGSVWTNLAQSGTNPQQSGRQQRLAEIIRTILTNIAEQERYAGWLSNALRLDASEIQSLLWEHPRPLITQVLPTALRRLETDWRSVMPDVVETQVRNSPLPEFAPANLFSDLNLPEVTVVLPRSGGLTPEPVTMPIAQALREFAPGRVSRRFGLSHGRERHWIAPQLDSNRVQAFGLDAHLSVERLGDWLIRTFPDCVRRPVYRPRIIRAQLPPANVVDTSNARLRWQTQIVGRQQGLVFAPPQRTPWTELVSDVRFHTHQSLGAVEVRRMTTVSEAAVASRDGNTAFKRFEFEIAGEPAALGFSVIVDAMCIRLRIPEALWSDIAADFGTRNRAVRTARFHHEAIQGNWLETIDSPFAREWLAHLMLAALSNEAMAQSIGLEEAAANLAAGTADLGLERTLDILFQSAVVDDVNGQINTQDRLRQELAAAVADPRVRAGLFGLAPFLWTPMDASWEPWLREKFVCTVACAAVQAVLRLCPEIDGDALVVDLDAGPREDDDVLHGETDAEIWLSEAAPGANGHIEEALRQYADDPRRFFSQMTAALRDNDFALSDYQLRRFLETVVEGDPTGMIATSAMSFRNSSGADQTNAALTAVRESLAMDGFVAFHSFIVALINRVLRPGTSRESDSFFLESIRIWNEQEERLGVELDARVLAYRLSRRDDIDAALQFAGIDAPTVNPDQWRFGVIYGLLWPRGAQIRQSGLSLYSPYSDLPSPEPLLLRSYLVEGFDPIDVTNPGWKEVCLERLAEVGAATLVCPIVAPTAMAEAFGFIATNPVQGSYLSVFARLQAIRRLPNSYEVDLDVAEASQ